jgi:MFS family permease
MLLFAVMFMAATQFSFVLELDGIHGATMRSLYLGAVTLAGTLISFAYGALQQRLTVSGAFAAALACEAFALVTIATGTGPISAIVGALLMGTYTGVLGPYIYHVVSERSEPASRPRAIGVLSAFGYLGGFLNPILAVPIADVTGLRNLFLLVGLAMAVATVIAGVGIVRRRTAIASEGATSTEA